MSVSNRLRTAALAALLMVGSLFVGGQAAQAVSCSGSGCDGKDPKSTGCASSAITIAQRSNFIMAFDLRYSTTCKTWWARVTQPSHMYDEISVDRNLTVHPGGFSYHTAVLEEGGWTAMFVTSNVYLFRACGNATNQPLACTNWYMRT